MTAHATAPAAPEAAPATAQGTRRALTFGSLFAGIGGIDLGLERAGMECHFQVELDDYATRVLAKHWPDVPRFRDVRDVGAHNLPRVDVLAGGFPCQDISSAGKRTGIGGARSGLWREFARLIRELRPRYIVVENVAMLLSAVRRHGRIVGPAPIGVVLGDLATLGYDAEWHCIPVAAAGAPHKRERIFIVARCANGADRAMDTDRPRRELTTQHQGARSPQVIPSVARLLPANGIGAAWRDQSSICRVAHGVPARVDRLRGLGNAVVPQVAQFVGEMIVAHYEAHT